MQPFSLKIKLSFVFVCWNLQMALQVFTALSYLLSAGQLTANVLLLLVLSAAARYSELIGGERNYTVFKLRIMS